MKKYLLIALSVLLFLPNLFHKDINPVLKYNNIERFIPKFSYLNTIEKLENYIDSSAKIKVIPIGDNLPYLEVLTNVISDRFYHGFSHYALNENWIAAVAGKFIWVDLACKVTPQEIIKHDYAGCSQQELVVMKLLRSKNISYRSVGFAHHYAIEIMINGQWYYFDSNMEPNIQGEQRCSENWHNSADSLQRYYNAAEFNNLDVRFGKNPQLIYGPVNEIPAAHARFFNSVTGVISKIAWIFPLLFIFFPRKKD